MSLADFTAALRMREIMGRMISDSIESIRPRIQYATVTEISRSLRKCKVQFIGDTTEVMVSMGSIQPQKVGQTVRIDGVPGDRFVADVMGPVWQDSPQVTDITFANGGNLTALMNSRMMVAGGGAWTTTATAIGWSYRLLFISVGKGPSFSTAGHFEVIMPPDGTVIPGQNGAPDVTVSGGLITIPTWSMLYYELPIGSTLTSKPENFRIVQYNSGTSWTVPAHWIPIALSNGEGHSTKWITCVGPMDYWRQPLPLLNGWVWYGAGFATERYRKDGNVVRLKGLIKNGTISTSTTGNAFILPEGFRPAEVQAYDSILNNAQGRIDLYPTGDVRVVLGTGSWISLHNVQFIAEL